MRISSLRHWHWAVSAALVLMLHGCGFHLRGETSLTADIAPLWIEKIAASGTFPTQISQTLKRRGVVLAPDRNGARTLLRIHEHRSDSRVLSVDSSGKVLEYELYESFRFSLHSADGNVLVEDQPVGTARSIGNAEDLILGKQHEQDTIRTEMRRQLIDDMLRRIEQQLS